MLIATLNVEGFASAHERGLEKWIANASPDILALQEIWSPPKAWDKSWPDSYCGMHAIWNPSATKPGASGTALLCRKKPIDVSFECDVPRMEGEGRWICASFPDFRLVNVYVPYFWSGDREQDKPCKKLLDELKACIKKLMDASGELMVIGDFNIAPALHRDYTKHIKASDPNTWPYKKKWMASLADIGLIDIHDNLGCDPNKITWYNSRLVHANPSRRKGTRIDYHFVTKGLGKKAVKYQIDCNTAGFDKDRMTDHCAVMVNYEM